MTSTATTSTATTSTAATSTAATSTAAADTAAADTATGEGDAVLAVLHGVYDAWAANDADVFVADYLEDATVVQPGVFKKDRGEIRTTMAAGFSGPLKGTRVIDRPVSVRFLGHDTALVISEAGIVFPGQEAVAPEAMVRATWVLVKRQGRWLVAAYHNSPVG